MPKRAQMGQSKTAPSAPQRATTALGFSLIELLVTLAISAILVAFAIPEVVNTVYLSRLRSDAGNLSGLLQQGRITAEQKNVTIPVYTGTVQSGLPGAFIACSSASCPSGGNGQTYQTGDTAVPFTGGVTSGAAGSAPTGLNPGFSPEPPGTTLYFSPRGVTEKAAGASFQLSNGFVFYLTDSHNDWAAVSISMVGKSKVWIWNGSGWN